MSRTPRAIRRAMRDYQGPLKAAACERMRHEARRLTDRQHKRERYS